MDHHLLINKKLATSNLRRICRFDTAMAREETRKEILDAKAEDSKLFHKLVNKQRGRLKHCVNELHVGGTTTLVRASWMVGGITLGLWQSQMLFVVSMRTTGIWWTWESGRSWTCAVMREVMATGWLLFST